MFLYERPSDEYHKWVTKWTAKWRDVMTSRDVCRQTLGDTADNWLTRADRWAAAQTITTQCDDCVSSPAASWRCQIRGFGETMHVKYRVVVCRCCCSWRQCFNKLQPESLKNPRVSATYPRCLLSLDNRLLHVMISRTNTWTTRRVVTQRWPLQQCSEDSH